MSINLSIISKANISDCIRFSPIPSVMNTDDGYNLVFDIDSVAPTSEEYNLLSTTKKVVIRLIPAFFHFYTDEFATLLLVNSLHHDFEVVVIDAVSKSIEYQRKDVLNAIDMFFLFLTDNKIKYTIIEMKDVKDIPISNYFCCSYFIDDSRNQATLLSEMSMKYVKNKEKENKVYIRSERVNDEPILEEYLKKYGFDIVERNTFNNFIDQMNYYYNSKVVISATCGGLVNISFMKQSSLVLELVTPVEGFIYDRCTEKEEIGYSIHHIYNTLCFQKGISYSSISNHKKDAYEIINSFENNKAMKAILEI